MHGEFAAVQQWTASSRKTEKCGERRRRQGVPTSPSRREWKASNQNHNSHNIVIKKVKKIRFAEASNESNVAADDATDDEDDVNVNEDVVNKDDVNANDTDGDDNTYDVKAMAKLKWRQHEGCDEPLM